MTYIGVDLHKDSMSIVGCKESGEIVFQERMPCKCIGKIEEFFAQPHLHPCAVVVEAIGFYHWLFDLLEGKVERLILANTVETATYKWTKPKTDFRDATKLALLLAGDEFERNNKSLFCFVPHETCCPFKKVTRYAHGLLRHNTSSVNLPQRRIA